MCYIVSVYQKWELSGKRWKKLNSFVYALGIPGNSRGGLVSVLCLVQRSQQVQIVKDIKLQARDAHAHKTHEGRIFSPQWEQINSAPVREVSQRSDSN